MFLPVLLGFILGTWGTGVCAYFFFLTRDYRRQRKLLVFGLGYLVIAVSIVGSLFVLLNVLVAMNVRHGTLQDSSAMWAYTCGLLLMAVAGGRSELKWRKSAGPFRR